MKPLDRFSLHFTIAVIVVWIGVFGHMLWQQDQRNASMRESCVHR